MPVECPNCRQPIPRSRLFFTTAWGRWQCSACGSLLGINVRRRLLATIPWIFILFLLLGVARITSYGVLIAVPVIIAAGMANYFLFDRPVVHERSGYRCRRCGYDLQGQVEARCPECGLAFDMAELDAHRAGEFVELPRPSRSRSAIGFAIVAGILTILLGLGLMYTRAVGSRAARQQAIITQQAGQAANRNSGSEESAVKDEITTAPAPKNDSPTESEMP
jgi:hypothetical protein